MASLTGSWADWPRRFLITGQLALRARREAHVPFFHPSRLRQRQGANLRRVAAHALRTVPFYQDVARAAGLRDRDITQAEDLGRLPLTDGLTMQKDPHRFVSSSTSISSLVELYSTGTAAYGSKSVFWRPRDLLAQLAHGERDRAVLRRLLGKSAGLVRLSFFHPDSSTAMVTRFHSERLLVPRAAMTTHWASCELSSEEIARRLDALRPDVVYSYGSLAESFLLHVLHESWNVALPRVWVFGGEAVTLRSRRAIEEGLGCLLYSTYQAVEAGRIGFECERRSGYHVNVDLCHLRLVDAQGETVEAGETGEVVISNLYGRGTVLLNYRLGDLAHWSEQPCPCGRTLPLLHLTGARTGSTLRLRDGQTVHEHVILHACKERMHDVLQFRIVELAPESIVWEVVARPGTDRTRLAEDLVRGSRSVTAPGADVRVAFVDHIERRGGKLSRIVTAGPSDHADGSECEDRQAGDDESALPSS